MTNKKVKTSTKKDNKEDAVNDEILKPSTDAVSDKETITSPLVDTDIAYQTVLVGHAPKLSARTAGLIGYELALNIDDNGLYLRLTRNDSGGLFSKEWVSLDAIYTLLESLDEGKPFKSSAFKTVMKGGSSNNVSFLSAVLRSEEIALIIPSDKSKFLHAHNPLLINRREHLLTLKPLPSPAD